MDKVYFDYIAGNPLDERVKEEMIACLPNTYGNPQSLHSFGQAAKETIERARIQVAKLIGAQPEEIFFTSSGTESNNFALKGIAFANQKKGKHIIISSIEHQSILYSAKFLENLGFKISFIPVDKYGIVSLKELERLLTGETIIVSVMLANNEIGTIEPIADIAKIIKDKGIIFHSDAVGAAGNIPVDVKALGVDTLSLAANQFYGPSGGAALYIREGVRIVPLLNGGIQEEGKRAGTENILAIVGMGKAARIAYEEMQTRSNYIQGLRDLLIQRISKEIKYAHFTGHPEKRLPNQVSCCIEFIEGEAMLLSLDMQGIAVSSGSACTSRALKSSHVLKAIGVEDALAQGSIVFSLGKLHTEKDIDYLISVFPNIIDRLRKMSPLYTKHIKQEKEIKDGLQ